MLPYGNNVQKKFNHKSRRVYFQLLITTYALSLFDFMFEYCLDLKLEWSNCGLFLAVAGWCVVDKVPRVKFYSVNGIVRFTLNIPSKASNSVIC